MEKRKFFAIAAYFALGLLALWAVVAWLLPLFWPLVPAFLVAAVTRRPACALREKTGMPASVAAGICVLVLYLLLGAALFLLSRTLLRELGSFLREVPSMAEQLLYLLEDLRLWLTDLTLRLPDGVSAALTDAVNEAFGGGAGFARSLPAKLLAAVTVAAGKLPGAAMFLVTAVVASFLAAAALPRMQPALGRLLPPPWRNRLALVWHRCRTAVGGWLRAQAKLLGVTFLLVTVGLFLLGQPYPLLLGAVIALVDLLPVLGTGAVLLPWGLWQFVGGKPSVGVGLLVLYGVTAVTRLTLEPRFLGKQMGIPPLLTLTAVYAGYRAAGFAGLLLAPIAASVALQMFRLSRK